MPAVTTAAEMLTYAAERGIAWVFLARIGVMQALHRNEERVFNPDRKDTHRYGSGHLRKRSGETVIGDGPRGPRP